MEEIMKKSDTEKQELEKSNPLDDVKLSEEKQKGLLVQTFGEAFLEKLPVVGSLLGYLQKYQNKVDSARVAILLSSFQKQLGSLSAFKDAFSKLLISNAGLLLFNKTVRIVNHGNFDQEYILLLAKLLKWISDTDFEDMFQEHDYVLSQVEKLSPQALIVLSSVNLWKDIPLSGGTTVSGQTVLGDWNIQAATFFVRSKGITDKRMEGRVAHAFQELESNSLTYLTSGKRIALSSIGMEVHRYIS